VLSAKTTLAITLMTPGFIAAFSLNCVERWADAALSALPAALTIEENLRKGQEKMMGGKNAALLSAQ